MFFTYLLISYFLRNGFTVDDLSALIATAAVIILTTGVIYRAAVGLLRPFFDHLSSNPNHLAHARYDDQDDDPCCTQGYAFP